MSLWYPDAVASIIGIFHIKKQIEQCFISRIFACITENVSTFNALRVFTSLKLDTNCRQVTATNSSSSTDKRQTSKAPSKSAEDNTIKFNDLLQHFKSVQSRHEKQRRLG